MVCGRRLATDQYLQMKGNNMKKVCCETSKKKRAWILFKRNWMRYLMLLIPIIYIIIFEYGPLYGLQIGFRDYRVKKGIFGSDWVGLKHFQMFFSNYRWVQYVGNTLKISLYSILVGFPIPIFLALMIHVNDCKWLKKITQNVSYIPHFISVVVMVGILWNLLNPFGAVLSALRNLTGWEFFNTDLRANPDAFIHLYVWSGVWQNMGWSAIIYVSALSAVPKELHEAARIDGASRWKRVLHIDIPTIMPTIISMLILRFGSVLNVGRDKVFLMQNSLNLSESEVISTYVYKFGLSAGKLSFGTAVGMMNSFINLGLLLLVNWISKKVTSDEYGLF